MPTSKRDSIKRKHTAVANAITRAQEFTLELHDMFKGPHPEYAEGYMLILNMLQQAYSFIDTMRKHI